MYKDNGTVDVEFLADVGYIANRVRILDEKLTTLPPNPLDANTAQIFCPHTNASAATAHPATQTNNSSSSSSVSNVKASERIINEFYDTHQNYHRNRERAAVEKHFREKSPSKLLKLSNGGHTMNNTNRGEPQNSTIRDNSSAPSDTEVSSIGDTAVAVTRNAHCVDDDDATIAQRAPVKRQQTGRGSISQPMPEIQISSSEDTEQGTNSGEQIAVSPGSPLNSDERAGTGSCGHYCGGWQSAICTDQLSDEDLRALVVELKQRVDFTERMNWLCEYLAISSFACNKLTHTQHISRILVLQ